MEKLQNSQSNWINSVKFKDEKEAFRFLIKIL